MARMTAMDAAVHILVDEGVRTIFGIPGAGILPFYQSLQRNGKIRHYVTRHEEGAIFAADGLARVTGSVGVCAATSGPGATNFVTGLYTAYTDSIPVIAITGQNVRAQLGKEAFQAVDIAEIVRPITKKSYCVKEPAQVPWVFREAFRIAREGRPGPVLIDLPLDVQKGEIEYDPAADTSLPITKTPPSPGAVSKAVDILSSAEKPVMLLGGGVILAEAWDEFRALAERLQVPVVTSYMGKGGFPMDHPLYAGQVGIQCNTRCGNATFLDSDVVLAVGCRFNDRHTGEIGVYTGNRRFIQIDVDPGQMGKNLMPEVGIVADAKLALQALLDEVERRNVGPLPDPTGRVRRLPEERKRLERKWDYDGLPIKPQRALKEVNEFFGDDVIYVTCIGLNQIWAGQFLKVSKPRHFIDCGGAGPLGWDLPAAIGVKVACPEKQVVQIVGDYGIEFCMEQMAVACHYKIPFVVVIINNGNLSLIRQAEKYQYNMRYEIDIWYGDQKVDFVKLAEAFGAYGERVTEPEQIKPALQRAVDAGRLAVVDVIVEKDTDCSMGTSIDSIREFE
ncbi:MAG: biosynthetic-type acetolactate synthase large subunit [Deltaproteobacteria bacterium]|nr:biosynthetic-type acetolactate synthase large subunit [Deltaproteobacteria bacterium]